MVPEPVEGHPPTFRPFCAGALNMSDHLKGLLITTLGVLILSPDALLIRLLHADTWTVIFWRGIAFSIGTTLIMLMVYRGTTLKQFIKIGKPGLLIGSIFGVSSLLFTTSVQHTSIANTLVIIGTSPAFSALFSWIFLKEKVATRTWITMVVLFITIALIMSESLHTGGFWGDLSALAVAILMGVSFTLTRKFKHTNMVPAMALSGLLGACIAGIVALNDIETTLRLSPDVIPYLILAGIIVSLAFALITLGPRYITAPEVSLIMPLETVFGSYLGWIFLNEKPALLTIVGGIIIILTLSVHAWFSMPKKHSI